MPQLEPIEQKQQDSRTQESIDRTKLKEIQIYIRQCFEKVLGKDCIKGTKIFSEPSKNFYRYKVYTSQIGGKQRENLKLQVEKLVKRMYPEIEMEVLDNTRNNAGYNPWQYGVNFRIPYHLINVDNTLGESEDLEEGFVDTIKNGVNKAKDFYKTELAPSSVKPGGKYEKNGFVKSTTNESKEIRKILEGLEKVVIKEAGISSFEVLNYKEPIKGYGNKKYKIVRAALNDEGHNGFVLLDLQNKKVISYSVSGVSEEKEFQELNSVNTNANFSLAKEIFDTLNKRGAGLGDASISIIKSILDKKQQ